MTTTHKKEVNTMQINVETKFEVGQEVFLIKKDRKVIKNKEKCEICNGKGHIIFKGYTMSCPECDGNKYIYTNSQIIDNYFTDKKAHAITSIGITITAKSVKKIYKIDGKPYERKKVSENEIFATQEEAETRCSELNKEVTTNGNR